MPTFGSESYRSTNELETIRPKETYANFINPSAIVGPDWIPEIVRLQPNTAVAGAADFQMTIIGTYFLKTSVIIWNGQEVLTTYTNPNTLKTTVKSSNFPASIQVTVRNNKTSALPKSFTFT